MSGIWNNLKSLGDEYLTRLRELYAKRNFPYEVRGQFADWLEEKNWNFDEHQPENMQYASDLLRTMMNKLEQYCTQHQEDLMSQVRHHAIKKQFFDVFGNKPQLLVATVRDILNEEKQMLSIKNIQGQTMNRGEAGSSSKVVNNPNCHNDYVVLPTIPSQSELLKLNKKSIGPALEKLKKDVLNLDTFIKQYRNKQEDFVIQYQAVQKKDSEMQQASTMPNGLQREQQLQQLSKEKQDIEKMLQGKAEYLITDRGEIMNRLFNIEKLVRAIGTQIMEELLGWKVMLQKSLSGAPKPGSLDEIQGWFEILTDILWHFYSLAAQYKLLFDMLPITRCADDKNRIENLVKEIVANLTTLIMQSFVVDKQPPQVLKTQTKFQASVRLLVGSKLNLQMNCPEVVVSILSERQCKELVQGKKLEEIGNCGDILNATCMMEHNKERTVLQAEFKNLQLRKIKRQDRKGQESVLEAKSALVFSAKLNISGDSLPVIVMSVPVVVVVHGNQGPNSEATIIWDNMFSQPDREPFDVPEGVSWKEMSIALNARWMMINETELHLDHLMFLKDKIYQNIECSAECPQPNIPWSAFNKEPIKNRNFTFWEWFHGAIEVVRKNLKDHWKYNCLEFMTRQIAHMKLLEKNPGTFLIRFSEGELGAVTIAWCAERNGKKDILMLQPWSSKDFSIRGLADRIFDLPELTHLFPDIPKELAFGQFRSREVPSDNDPSGYVPSGIVARILPPLADQMSDISEESISSNPMDYQTVFGYNMQINQHTLSPFDDVLVENEVRDSGTLQNDDFAKMMENVGQCIY